MAALSYEAANTNVVSVRHARQQRVPREAHGGDEEARRDEEQQGAELGERERHEVVDPAGDVGQLAGHRALELVREDDLPEAAPRSPGARRRAAHGTARRGAGARGRAGPRPRSRRRAPPAIDLRSEHDPRLDGEHEQADRRDQQQRQAVVGERDAEHGRREDDGPVGAARGGVGRRGAPPRRRRAAPSAAGARRSTTRRTACRACASAPAATRHTSGESPNPIAAATPTGSGTRSLRVTTTVRPTAVAIEDRRQQVDRERGRAERREHDRRHPADDRVRREPGRVHRARAAGGRSGPRPCPRRRGPGAGSPGRRRPRRSRRRAAAIPVRSLRRGSACASLPAKQLAPDRRPRG